MYMPNMAHRNYVYMPYIEPIGPLKVNLGSKSVTKVGGPITNTLLNIEWFR